MQSAESGQRSERERSVSAAGGSSGRSVELRRGDCESGSQSQRRPSERPSNDSLSPTSTPTLPSLGLNGFFPASPRPPHLRLLPPRSPLPCRLRPLARLACSPPFSSPSTSHSATYLSLTSHLLRPALPYVCACLLFPALHRCPRSSSSRAIPALDCARPACRERRTSSASARSHYRLWCGSSRRLPPPSPPRPPFPPLLSCPSLPLAPSSACRVIWSTARRLR